VVLRAVLEAAEASLRGRVEGTHNDTFHAENDGCVGAEHTVGVVQFSTPETVELREVTSQLSSFLIHQVPS
jgi:hypothetical protein